MANPINRAAVASAFGIQADHATKHVFKRLAAASLIPAPLDAEHDQFDLSAVQALLGGAAAAVKLAKQVSAEHRGSKPLSDT